MKLENQYETLLNNPRLSKDMLGGYFIGNIPTEFNKKERYPIYIQVKLYGKKSTGFLRPYFETDMVTYWLPSYVYLTKQE